MADCKKISIVMVDGSFRERFHAVDSFCSQDMPVDEYELTWVEYYDKVSPELEKKAAKYPNFKILKLCRTGEYHSSYCFNAGIVASSGTVIAVPDADQVVEKDFLSTVVADHAKDERLVAYILRYDEPEKIRREDIDMAHLRRVCVLKNPSNYGGCLTIRKKWLMEINGYEQHPSFGSGFHANGMDVYTRLRNLGLNIKWHPTLKLYHPYHAFTLAAHPNYKPQHCIIEYNLLNLKTAAFEGIDSNKNIAIPESLSVRLNAAVVGK